MEMDKESYEGRDKDTHTGNRKVPQQVASNTPEPQGKREEMDTTRAT